MKSFWDQFGMIDDLLLMILSKKFNRREVLYRHCISIYHHNLQWGRKLKLEVRMESRRTAFEDCKIYLLFQNLLFIKIVHVVVKNLTNTSRLLSLRLNYTQKEISIPRYQVVRARMEKLLPSIMGFPISYFSQVARYMNNLYDWLIM